MGVWVGCMKGVEYIFIKVFFVEVIVFRVRLKFFNSIFFFGGGG